MTALSAQIEESRARSDALFQVVNPAAMYDRPVPERHRPIFYLGHLEAFDWNLFSQYALNRPSFHPSFDKLFAFGIDPGPGGTPADSASDWPDEKEVRGYAARTRREIDLDRIPETLLHVALEHRLMHAETLAYLIHNLPYESKRGPVPQPCESRRLKSDTIEIPAGTAVLGRPRGDGFGWDNEFERHEVEVPAFRISRHKLTNGEYLDYVRAGAKPPHFWIARDGKFFLRAMFGEIPLPLDWPVYATHAEASAYANWRRAALPNEAQFHRAAEGAAPVNVDFERWDPVASDVGGMSRHGAMQMLGNGWEWTSTVFAPFEGFEPFAFYPGYSANFFDGEHYVLKGASPRTASCFLRASFRNWFRADYPYLYAGFRLVEIES
ncbi:MAG: SUMF1/EgtB/PvdO family nonheme iron enzyme [Bryobacteraceae bacterium]